MRVVLRKFFLSLFMIDKLAWVRLEHHKLLVARSRGSDTYYLPGGKREPGELDHDALRREIVEELSVSLVPASIQFIGEFEAPAHHKPTGTTVRLRCYSADYQGTLAPAAEIDALAWFTYADRSRVSPAAQLVFEFAHAAGELL